MDKTWFIYFHVENKNILPMKILKEPLTNFFSSLPVCLLTLGLALIFLSSLLRHVQTTEMLESIGPFPLLIELTGLFSISCAALAIGRKA